MSQLNDVEEPHMTFSFFSEPVNLMPTPLSTPVKKGNLSLGKVPHSGFSLQ